MSLVIDRYLIKALRQLPSPSVSTGNATTPSRSVVSEEDYKDRDLILFSTAGIGKTRLILNTLDDRWGMYMMAPGVPQGDSSLIQPVRCHASADTSSLFEDLSILKPVLIFERVPFVQLVHARRLVFDAFRDKQFAGPHMINHHNWMLLQISCSRGCDPFDATWRLVRYIKPKSEVKYKYDMKLWCLDEAQIAFEDPSASSMLMSLWIEIDSPISSAILAGTSLKLGEARDMIVQARDMRYRKELQIKTNFERVENPDGFWDLFEDHFWSLVDETKQKKAAMVPASKSTVPMVSRAGRMLDFEVDLSDTEYQKLERLRQIRRSADPEECDLHDLRCLHQVISKECSHFFGRYRWSVLFIEQLLKEAIKAIKDMGHVSQLSVSDAVSSTIMSITEALSSQLERIKDKPWIEDLYWMAIRADVFSQSSILEDETACLVSEGFALVIPDQVVPQTPKKKTKARQKPPNDIAEKGNYVKSILCEPLTVKAVMEYLHTSGNYEKMMDKFFSLLQVDNLSQSSLGNIGEYVLASISTSQR